MARAPRRTEPSKVSIPAALAGPVEVALARSADGVTSPNVLPGGARYKVKWDGYLHEPWRQVRMLADVSRSGSWRLENRSANPRL
jgi:hypothetical protein